MDHCLHSVRLSQVRRRTFFSDGQFSLAGEMRYPLLMGNGQTVSIIFEGSRWSKSAIYPSVECVCRDSLKAVRRPKDCTADGVLWL
jgi:hypothetical protein